MSYKLEDTHWKFTAPNEGEVDSAEKKIETLREIDQVIPDPGIMAQLLSRGLKPEDPDVTDPDSPYYDPSFVFDEYQGKWVTTLHWHPTPQSVPEADHSKESDHATEADNASTASKLDPGFSINGKHTDGATNVTINLNDIPDAFRVWYGTVEPGQFKGFPKQLREKDLYVKIS